MLQGEYTPYTPKVWGAADINVVEHLKHTLTENKNMYSVSSKVRPDDMKEVLRDLIFVKRYVRNALNHASEKRHLADEYDEYFSDVRYDAAADLSVTEIETIIRNAVDLIRRITC